MTDSAFFYPAATRPPRHFWRRSAAFLVDMALFYAVTGIISLVVYFLTGWNMGIVHAQTTTCEPAPPSALTRQVDTEWPLSAGETRVNQICVTSGFMLPDQRVFSSTVTKIEDGGTSNRSASIVIDEAGNAIAPDKATAASVSIAWLGAATSAFGSPLLGLLFIFASARMTSGGRRTPGKALLSLKIIDATKAAPTFQRSLKRELLKLLPIVFLDGILSLLFFKSMLDLVMAAGGDFSGIILAARNLQMLDFGFVFGIQAIGSILIFTWWFGSFIIWRGQTFYDRIAGCFVIRSTAPTL